MVNHCPPPPVPQSPRTPMWRHHAHCSASPAEPPVEKIWNGPRPPCAPRGRPPRTPPTRAGAEHRRPMLPPPHPPKSTQFLRAARLSTNPLLLAHLRTQSPQKKDGRRSFSFPTTLTPGRGGARGGMEARGGVQARGGVDDSSIEPGGRRTPGTHPQLTQLIYKSNTFPDIFLLKNKIFYYAYNANVTIFQGRFYATRLGPAETG